MKTRTITSNVGYVNADDSVVKCSCKSSAISIYLNPSKSYPENFTIAKTDTTSNAITVYPNGSETIDGSASVTITGANSKKTFSPIDGGFSVIDNVYDVVSPALKFYNLGAAALASTPLLVSATPCFVGNYTILNQPDIPRNVTVSATPTGDADTLGTIVITGTNYIDAVITETITPLSGQTVAGTKAFKTITNIAGVGWVTNGDADLMNVGTGNKLGLPVALTSTAEIPLAVLGTSITAHNPVAAGTVEGTTVDMSAGTYDGSKKAQVFVLES